MSLIEIRPARRDEALEIARVHVRADRETYRPIFGRRFEATPPDASLARWEHALGDGEDLLVATDRGRIVGFGHVGGAWMSALYLLASHHRRGLGGRLLARLLGRARRRGVAEIAFYCVADNAAAIGFYQAKGAILVARKTQGEGDMAWDDVLFTLATVLPDARGRG